MTFNPQGIIQDIRADCETMLVYVTGERARTTTADEAERGLFKMLIEMGLKLLTLFFIMRSQNAGREALKVEDGSVLYYHRDTKRRYVSIFGELSFRRPYFYRKGQDGQTPLDAELSLGDDCYSDLVREVNDYLSVYGVYHKTSDILERLLGLKLSTRAIQANLAEDAGDVSAYYAQKPAPVASSEAAILVIQADGKGIPMILEATQPDKWKQPSQTKYVLGKAKSMGARRKPRSPVYTALRVLSALPSRSLPVIMTKPVSPSHPNRKTNTCGRLWKGKMRLCLD